MLTAPQTQNDYLREWLLKRESFLHLLVEQEALPNNGTCHFCAADTGIFLCSDCFGGLVHCTHCLLDRHKILPFHRIRKWNNKYFAPTTLLEQGYILYLGHGGNVCPSNRSTKDIWEDVDDGSMGLSGSDALEADVQQVNLENLGEGMVDIVHTTGVFRNNVRWCGCPNAPDKPVQLFQAHLFSASYRRPETAFTFDALDYFSIDLLECKTSAASFYKKVCRLSNNAFPHTVKVGLSRQRKCLLIVFCRIVNGNYDACPDNGEIYNAGNDSALPTIHTENREMVIWHTFAQPALSLA
jgi:hypothetical protein